MDRLRRSGPHPPSLHRSPGSPEAGPRSHPQPGAGPRSVRTGASQGRWGRGAHLPGARRAGPPGGRGPGRVGGPLRPARRARRVDRQETQVRRVLLLVVNDFPPLLGGEATLYHALARHLEREEAVVLAPKVPGDTEVDAALPVEVARRWLPRHGGTIRRMARGLLGAAYLAGLLLRRRFDYLVCGQLLSIGAPLSVLARLGRIPYAVIVHGADLADYADNAVLRSLAGFILSKAHTVLVNSRFTASLVDRILPGAARRIVVLPMGVEPAPPVSPARVRALKATYGIREGPVLLSVSRLVPMKGHDIVISAPVRLLPRLPELGF